MICLSTPSHCISMDSIPCECSVYIEFSSLQFRALNVDFAPVGTGANGAWGRRFLQFEVPFLPQRMKGIWRSNQYGNR